MPYQYITDYTAKNQTPGHLCRQVFGYERDIIWITLHWWGEPLGYYNPQRFWDITAYLASANDRQVSASYTAERGKVACLIADANASWANGNSQGNAQSITIEGNPECSQEDKETVAELVADLRMAYPHKKMVLVPHSYWTSTECPGAYDVFEIDDMALKIERDRKHGENKQNEKKDWFDMATEKDLEQIVDRRMEKVEHLINSRLGDVSDVPQNYGSEEWRKKNPKWFPQNVHTKTWYYAIEAASNAAAARALVEKLAEKQGITADEIHSTVKNAVTEALKESTVDVDIDVQGKQ